MPCSWTLTSAFVSYRAPRRRALRDDLKSFSQVAIFGRLEGRELHQSSKKSWSNVSQQIGDFEELFFFYLWESVEIFTDPSASQKMPVLPANG